jgi:hypothetical protein
MAKLVDVKMALVAGHWVAVKVFSPEISREKGITKARFTRRSGTGGNFVARDRGLKLNGKDNSNA